MPTSSFTVCPSWLGLKGVIVNIPWTNKLRVSLYIRHTIPGRHDYRSSLLKVKSREWYEKAYPEDKPDNPYLPALHDPVMFSLKGNYIGKAALSMLFVSQFPSYLFLLSCFCVLLLGRKIGADYPKTATLILFTASEPTILNLQ